MICLYVLYLNHNSDNPKTLSDLALQSLVINMKSQGQGNDNDLCDAPLIQPSSSPSHNFSNVVSHCLYAILWWTFVVGMKECSKSKKHTLGAVKGPKQARILKQEYQERV